MITLELLRHVCPSSHARLELFAGPLAEVAVEFNLNTPARVAAFLGQFAHETQGFTHLEENLRYTTVEALMGATKPRWDPLDADDAWGYLNQPERLANRIYGGRNGNGPESSGDGWRFRGRGLPHLTFRGNYARAGRDLQLDLETDPEIAADIETACRIGGWFWRDVQGNRFADAGDFDILTRKINGGTNGLASRIAYRDRCLKAFT